MSRSSSCELPLDFMGFDFLAAVDYRVTYDGCPAQLYGPPENCYPEEPPEWDVDRITIYRDDGTNAPEHIATGALFAALCHALEDAIYQDVIEFLDGISGADEYEIDYWPEWEDA